MIEYLSRERLEETLRESSGCSRDVSTAVARGYAARYADGNLDAWRRMSVESPVRVTDAGLAMLCDTVATFAPQLEWCAQTPSAIDRVVGFVLMKVEGVRIERLDARLLPLFALLSSARDARGITVEEAAARAALPLGSLWSRVVGDKRIPTEERRLAEWLDEMELRRIAVKGVVGGRWEPSHHPEVRRMFGRLQRSADEGAADGSD